MARDSNYVSQSVIRTNMALDMILSAQQKQVLELAMLDPSLIKKYKRGQLNLEATEL
jgi:hypothetical protein